MYLLFSDPPLNFGGSEYVARSKKLFQIANWIFYLQH